MLQIISGKFFNSDDRFHNDCKGIFYSNVSFSGKRQIEYIQFESVEAYNNVSSYVISYDNQLQKLPASMQFVKIGEHEITRQLKNILSFSLNCIFDEDKATVEKVCRTKGSGQGRNSVPSDFIKDTLDMKRTVDDKQMDDCVKFFRQMIGLNREDYIRVLNCLIAYNTSIRLLNEDINLAYSMLVYCLESLTQQYDRYEPGWDDYNQNKKLALEKVFSRLSEEDASEIKAILIKDEHFKLSQRFRNFVFKYLDDKFYQRHDERRVIHKDDIEIAVKNAYITRSKYAHILKPIMKQLTMADFSKVGDTFEFMHETFFTYSGLLRTVRMVIINFIFSLETVETEAFNWNNDLPGLFEIQPAPYFWIWKPAKENGEGVEARLEGFLNCLVYFRNNIPQLDNIVKLYFEHLSEMQEHNRHAAYVFGYLYTRIINNISKENKDCYNYYIDKYKTLFNKCCIYNLLLMVMPVDIEQEIAWQIEECEKEIEDYNKKKHNKNRLRLPPEIETMIYLLVANGSKEDSHEVQKKWLWKAYYNANNLREIQEKIKVCIDSDDVFDISVIWDNIYSRFVKKE